MMRKRKSEARTAFSPHSFIPARPSQKKLLSTMRPLEVVRPFLNILPDIKVSSFSGRKAGTKERVLPRSASQPFL